MSKEKISKIFEETYCQIREKDNDEEQVMEKISFYCNENGKMSLENMVAFAYLEGIKTSIRFMGEFLNNVIDSEELQEEFRKEMFQDVMKEAQEQMKKTGKNPFDF